MNRRFKPRSDEELAQMIGVQKVDPMLRRIGRSYSPTLIRELEEKKAPWLYWRRKRQESWEEQQARSS